MDGDVAGALWIDLYRPQAPQIAAVEQLGLRLPTLEDMEEIELSNRLYTADGADYMTVVLPGRTPDGDRMAGPITFVLTERRLITVRHHDLQPFRTFPTRANQGVGGVTTPHGVFFGLLAEIIGRLADLMEDMGQRLDRLNTSVLSQSGAQASSKTAIGPWVTWAAKGRCWPIFGWRFWTLETRAQLPRAWPVDGWGNHAAPADPKEPVARCAGAWRPCRLSGQSDRPDARCDVGDDHSEPEQHRADRVGGHRLVPAAHIDCLDLWDELCRHAGAAKCLGLSGCPPVHGAVRGPDLPVSFFGRSGCKRYDTH